MGVGLHQEPSPLCLARYLMCSAPRTGTCPAGRPWCGSSSRASGSSRSSLAGSARRYLLFCTVSFHPLLFSAVSRWFAFREHLWVSHVALLLAAKAVMSECPVPSVSCQLAQGVPCARRAWGLPAGTPRPSSGCGVCDSRVSLPLLPVLAPGHVWVLGPAAPADAWLWDRAVPHAEAQLEPGERLPGELCRSLSAGFAPFFHSQSFSSADTGSSPKNSKLGPVYDGSSVLLGFRGGGRSDSSLAAHNCCLRVFFCS